MNEERNNDLIPNASAKLQALARGLEIENSSQLFDKADVDRKIFKVLSGLFTNCEYRTTAINEYLIKISTFQRLW